MTKPAHKPPHCPGCRILRPLTPVPRAPCVATGDKVSRLPPLVPAWCPMCGDPNRVKAVDGGRRVGYGCGAVTRMLESCDSWVAPTGRRTSASVTSQRPAAGATLEPQDHV